MEVVVDKVIELRMFVKMYEWVVSTLLKQRATKNGCYSMHRMLWCPRV